MSSSRSPVVLGRYALHDVIASGGMATVHVGHLQGASFSRIVAIKRLHPQLSASPEFVAMFLDEARVASQIRHPNVVAPVDVADAGGEILVVFDYVHGDSLANLMRRARAQKNLPPPAVVSAIVGDLLRGLHAAHEAIGPAGEPLGVVHRDVSPQNVLVGVDGIARLIDFGVAKARARLQVTRQGQIKGKLAYMAPEQIRGREASPRSDLYSAGVVLWEAITGRRLFSADSEGALIERVLIGLVDPPSTIVAALPESLDALTASALDRDPSQRFHSALDMASALEEAIPRAGSAAVAAWVDAVSGEVLAQRAETIARLERDAHAAATGVGRRLLARLADKSGNRRGSGVWRRALIVAVGTTSVLALGSVALSLRTPAARAGAGDRTAEARPAASTPAPSDAALVPPPENETELVPPAGAEDAPPPTESPRLPARAAGPPPKRAKPIERRRDCEVPFTLDNTGRRIYKRECL